MDLKGKHIVVTGGAGALGSALVALLKEAGATVHAPSRAELDVTHEGSVTKFYADLPSLWASIHAAGGFVASPLVDTSLDAWRGQIDTNATSCFLCSREAVRAIRKSGGGGRIVNVASLSALSPTAGMAAYLASKAAVVALTQHVAAEALADGILVNAVAPQIIDTPANRKAMPNADHDKWPKPTEVAQSIVWLAGTENTMTSGTIVPIYGKA
jgi:NAD(P)-dependent dehydrogenase (short-subunit alcohol dehydrogenase family)